MKKLIILIVVIALAWFGWRYYKSHESNPQVEQVNQVLDQADQIQAKLDNQSAAFNAADQAGAVNLSTTASARPLTPEEKAQAQRLLNMIKGILDQLNYKLQASAATN